MLSLERCKTILNEGGKNYNIEELKDIRDFLYTIAEIEIESNEEKK